MSYETDFVPSSKHKGRAKDTWTGKHEVCPTCHNDWKQKLLCANSGGCSHMKALPPEMRVENLTIVVEEEDPIIYDEVEEEEFIDDGLPRTKEEWMALSKDDRAIAQSMWDEKMGRSRKAKAQILDEVEAELTVSSQLSEAQEENNMKTETTEVVVAPFEGLVAPPEMEEVSTMMNPFIGEPVTNMEITQSDESIPQVIEPEVVEVQAQPETVVTTTKENKVRTSRKKKLSAEETAAVVEALVIPQVIEAPKTVTIPKGQKVEMTPRKKLCGVCKLPLTLQGNMPQEGDCKGHQICKFCNGPDGKHSPTCKTLRPVKESKLTTVKPEVVETIKPTEPKGSGTEAKPRVTCICGAGVGMPHATKCSGAGTVFTLPEKVVTKPTETVVVESPVTKVVDASTCEVCGGKNGHHKKVNNPAHASGSELRGFWKTLFTPVWVRCQNDIK